MVTKFVIIIFLSRAVLSADNSGPVVKTKNGEVEGSRRLYNRLLYEEYLGIPFAAPPVDELRWQPPQPVMPWDGILNATSYSVHCTQLISPLYVFIGMGGMSGEDCLYLNIWVPNGVQANEGLKLPVMVWIYGGAFMFGTGEMYPGYALALHGNMIVVNFNYRVNALGWLSTGDSSLPGNYGLWDIQAALIWIQENIGAFSGDSQRVTIFGQSAGGALTSHTVISPQTRGLFNRAIAISGSSSGFFGIERHPLRNTVLLADVFNCTNVDTSADLVDCLRLQDPYALDFWSVVTQLINETKLPSFMPVVDGQIVPLLPVESWKQGYGRHVDLMTGSTIHDAAGFVILNPIALPSLGDKLNWAATNESLWFGLSLIVGGTENGNELITDIIARYPDMDTTDNYTRTFETTRAMTEWWFGSGSHFEAEQHSSYSSNGGTYHYQFQYRQTFLYGYPEWINGSHLDDVYSVLGDPFMETYRERYLEAAYNETDKIVSKNIMDYYTNFAYTGNPNDGPFAVPLEWPQFDPAQQNFMLQSTSFSVDNLDSATVSNYQYWMDFYSKMKWPPDPTFPLSDDQNYRVTEEELEVGVERLRGWMTQLLGDNEDALETILNTIDKLVEDRKLTRS